MTCPHCGKPVTSREARPFCSTACRRADLGRWLDGEYRISGAPADLDVDALDADPIRERQRWDD